MSEAAPPSGALIDPGTPSGALIEMDGERFYRIADYDALPPFLIALASDSDHWLYISSNGALTAGRRDPDNALFPYYTDDRIHDGQDQTGSKTLFQVKHDAQYVLWEPFSDRRQGGHRVTRSLAKSVLGNQIRFEEVNHDLGLAFSYSWQFSERFGFVRRASLTNDGAAPVELVLLDGIQNLLPAGVTRRFQLEYSTLADGYKRSELERRTGLGLFTLSSIPTDKAEPSESLRATTVFGEGLDASARLLSTAQLHRFRATAAVEEEFDVRGRRGAYFQLARITLPARSRQGWTIVAELNQDAAQVAATLDSIVHDKELSKEITGDVALGARNLLRIVATADGLQRTGDELDAWRHYANTLNNVLRGGIPDDGYRISRADFAAFVSAANRPLATRHAAFLASLPEYVLRAELVHLVEREGDPDLERLGREYLPLTFGRRHGDPSRPWNIFAIAIKDEAGGRLLDYQGNWRDVFQNWEALGLSFPGLVEAMIFKFLDCSTADGYNPYHVTRGGFDWEVTDPHDEWSFIGYWGDHQTIYLLKLLERFARTEPEALPRLLDRRLFAYANVPYRIKPYEALLADPQRTIDFDAKLDRLVRARAARIGADGKLLATAEGEPATEPMEPTENTEIRRATLAEKLLLLILVRLSNYVPGAGIWMNTQRPEWNDANNALVGNGVSVVTLCYLRRFLAFCRPLFAGAEATLDIAAEVAELFERISSALENHAAIVDKKEPISDASRKRLLDALGGAASEYRAALYEHGLSGTRTAISPSALARFCDTALRHVDHSIAANRREDGLYHSYNLLQRSANGLGIRRLYEMLEGQVAILGAGVLSPAESLAVLDALRSSRLYRADQESYLLYPDRRLPGFLEKNNLPAGAAERSALLGKLLERGDHHIVLRDVNGALHFHPALRNAALLTEALAALDPAEYGGLLEREGEQILALYEQTFDHQSFTGRSGTFYKYEGLGCIYWHMVSKLLLAVQEILVAVDRSPATVAPDTTRRLGIHYEQIRAGLGVHKSPALYGAIPLDPHSHTPSFAGAQQPGMTGQVKEDILSRQGELGLQIEEGKLVFRPGLLREADLLRTAARFEFLDVTGAEQAIELEAGMFGFTTCQVPVVVHRAAGSRIEATLAGGTLERIEGAELGRALSSAIFNRDGAVRRLDVFLAIGDSEA